MNKNGFFLLKLKRKYASHSMKWAVLLMSLIAASILVLGTTFAHEESDTEVHLTNQPPIPSISLIEAKQYAERHLAIEAEAGVFPEWNGAHVSEPTQYYSLSGTPNAYVFSVLRDGIDMGYITVSSDAIDNPILEYSSSLAPHLRSLERCTDIASQHGFLIDQSRPLFLGALSYYYRMLTVTSLLNKLGDGDNRIEEPAHLISMGDYSIDVLTHELLEQFHNRADEYALTQSSKPVETTAITGQKKELNVPSYEQYCYGGHLVGCGPVAAGTVMGYWADRCYPDLMQDGSGGDYVSTINHLHDLMGTWACTSPYDYCAPPGNFEDYGCTSWADIAPAIESFSEDQGYGDSPTDVKRVESSYYTSPAFSTYTKEIDGFRPLVVGMMGSEWGNHIVTGIGYDTNNGNFMVVNPNFGSGTSYVQWGAGEYSSISLTTTKPTGWCVYGLINQPMCGTSHSADSNSLSYGMLPGPGVPDFMLYDDYADTLDSEPAPPTMSIGQSDVTFIVPVTSVPPPELITAPTTTLPDTSPPSTPRAVKSDSHVISTWSGIGHVHLSWSPTTDLEGPVTGYSIAWDQNPAFEPTTEVGLPADAIETTSPALAAGAWYAHLHAIDQAGNASETVHLGPFLIDTDPPVFNTQVENQHLWSNQPQLPAFSWQAASDEGELVGYRLYWGNDPDGVGELFITETSFTPTEVPESDQPATRYLRVAAEDAAGNQSDWQTVAIWHYDPVAPTGKLTVANGSPTVRTLNVVLSLDASDEGSTVSQMRFSSDGNTWSAWEAFAGSKAWQLANTEEQQTIFAQVQDEAGNISETLAASITAVLNVELPSSPSYSIARSTFGMGGGAKSSPSYQVRGTSGQAHQTSNMQSISYQVNSGYWAGSVCPSAEFAASPTISTDGSTVTLDWSAAPGATSYNIYRDTTPYFTPTTSHHSTIETSWDDPDANAIGDPATNYFYIVKPVNDCGESSTIYRLGEFDSGLTPGS